MVGCSVLYHTHALVDCEGQHTAVVLGASSVFSLIVSGDSECVASSTAMQLALAFARLEMYMCQYVLGVSDHGLVAPCVQCACTILRIRFFLAAEVLRMSVCLRVCCSHVVVHNHKVWCAGYRACM